MRSYIVKENHIGSARSFGTNRQIDILLLYYKDKVVCLCFKITNALIKFSISVLLFVGPDEVF